MDDITLQVLEGIEEAAHTPAQPVAEAEPAADPRVTENEDGTQSPVMEHLGTYAGEQVNSAVIFASEGLNLTQKPKATPQYKRKLAEAARFYAAVVRGQVPLIKVQEAMMSSEFSALLGDTMDRVLLARYATYAPSYRSFLRGRTARDFRTIGSVRRNSGGRLTLTAQGEDYKEQGLSEASYTYAVKKYGKIYSLTWEMMVNDDLDSFANLPQEMADDAVQTEMYLASSLYVANTTLFATNHSHEGSTYSNKGTAALSKAALQAAVNAMVKYPGDEDKPLNNAPVYLVVPPALQLDALEILGSLMVQYAGGDATTGVSAIAYPTRNALAGMLQVVVDPYIPIIDATNGHTSWYLFSDPNRIHGAEYAFLRGYEQPQVFRKSANAMRLGGGEAEASFEDDSMGYKVRHVFGGSHANAAGGWRACYWSDGTA